MANWPELEEAATAALRTSADEGFFLADADQRVVGWSPGMAQILGVPAEEALGQRCFELMRRLVVRDPLPCCRDCAPLRIAGQNRASACVLRRPQSLGAWSLLHEHVDTGQGEVVLHRLRDASLDVIAVRFLRRLVEAIETDVGGFRQAGEMACADNVELTRREADVLRFLGEGLDTRTIARRLGISYYTARNYGQSILTKLNAHNRVEAVVAAQRLGLLNNDGNWPDSRADA
jgi:DNA-binding CsgD family transcriptional regulator